MSSFPWADFLNFAETLAVDAQAENNETKRRISVGRAYYATFHAARDYAVAHGMTLPKPGEGSTHGKLWAELSYKPGKLAKLANHGKQLLKLRKHADYDAAPSLSSAHMSQGLQLARLSAQLLREVAAEDAAERDKNGGG